MTEVQFGNNSHTLDSNSMFNVQFKTEDFNRTIVVGTSGVGKSWVSKRIAETLGHPYIEMDQLYWKPNWTEPSVEEFRTVLQNRLQDLDRWITDGNYFSKSREIRWPIATAVVWVDYSFTRTLQQATARAIRRAVTKQELWPGTGNRESFRLMFSKDSVLLQTLKTFHSNRRRYQRQMDAPESKHLKFLRLRNRRQTDQFLEQLSKQGD